MMVKLRHFQMKKTKQICLYQTALLERLNEVKGKKARRKLNLWQQRSLEILLLVNYTSIMYEKHERN